MKIYTKTGDAGETGLFGGDRIAKTSHRIHAIGEVDELNAAIGLARVEAGASSLDPSLARIQSWLFDLGGELACPPGGKFEYTALNPEHAAFLEQDIDRLESRLPALKNFILPGGSPLAARLHFARSVCRRAERAVLALHREEPVRDEARVFLNRLSDWLFTAARTANLDANVEDVPWKRSEV